MKQSQKETISKSHYKDYFSKAQNIQDSKST